MDEFFQAQAPRADRSDGRYRLPHPETGREQSWTAASTHAKLPEDSFALTRWQLRQLLLGLRQRPDLVAMFMAWIDPTIEDLDGVIASAHEVAANDAKANRGTAIHSALQRVDAAWEEVPNKAKNDAWLLDVGVPEWALPHGRGYIGEMLRQGLTPISAMVERKVVNLRLGCAGTFDNLYAEADGTVAMGDKKTGRLDYPERAYAIQLAVYRDSDYLLNGPGEPTIDLRSLGLRDDYAVLVHCDPETGACSTYRVDLRLGRYGANLAAMNREWRNTKGLLLPYVPPAVQQPEVAQNVVRHLQSVPLPGQLGPGETVTVDNPVSGLVKTTLTGPNGGVIAERFDTNLNVPFSDDASGAMVGTPQAYEPQVPEPNLKTEGELMRLSKAAMQEYGRVRGVTDLAHNKPQLLPIFRAAGIVAGVSTSKELHATVPTKDPQELPAGPIGAAEDPTDPRTRAFHRARLAEVGSAQSAAELARINAHVVRVGGDQAWTDELASAARERLALIDATVQAPREAESVLGRVRAAQSSAEIGSLWDEVTVGGSAPERWTPELDQAAQARLAAVTPKAPANNPFVGTQIGIEGGS